MQQVNFDNIGLVEFPDDWSEDQIRSHLTANKDAIRKELISSRATMADQEAINEAPEATFMEKVGSGIGAAAQGAAKAFSGTPKALAEFGEFMNRNVADTSGISIGPEVINPVFGLLNLNRDKGERDAKKRPLYKLGKGIEDVAEKAAPIDPTLADSFLFTDVPGALGNMGAMLATGGIAGLAGRAPAMAASIGMGMAGEFEDTFEREMGRQKSSEETPDPDKAFAKSLGYSTIAGAIESRFGAGRLIRKYQKLFGSKTAEEVAKELAEKGVSPNYISSFLGGVAKDAAAGLGEETAQQSIQDLIVDGKLNPEGILRAGGAGGIAQALFGAPGSHFNAKRNGRTAPITQQVIEEAEGLQPLTADTVAAMEKEFVIDPQTPFVDLQPGVTKQNETQSNPAPVITTPVSEVVPEVANAQTVSGTLPVDATATVPTVPGVSPPAAVPAGIDNNSNAAVEAQPTPTENATLSTGESTSPEITPQPVAAVEPEQDFKPGDRVTWTTSKGKQLSGTVAEIGKDTVRIDTDGGKGKSVVSVKKLNAIPEIPKLRSMENQGDLLSTQSEDLALTGERGVDFERIQRENTEADQQAREAAEIQARQQLGFDIPTSEVQGADQRGTITVPPSADVQKGTAMTAEPVGASLPGPSAKKRPRIDRTSGDRPPDILDFVEQIGKIKLKSAARAGALEYYNDSHKQLMKTSFRKLFSHTGQAPDVIVDDLRRNRQVPDDFTVGDLWDSMLSAIPARKNYRQQYTQRNNEGDQFDQFSKIALENKRPKKSDRESAVEIPVENLNRGDQFKLQGVNVEVRRVDPETGARSMKDGDRFGYQDVPAKETIHADVGTLKKNESSPSKSLDEKLSSLKIDTEGKLFDALSGIPIAVWNGSIDAIRLAVRAGKALAEAIQDGIAYVRAQGVKVDEKAYSDAVQKHFAEQGAKTEPHSDRKKTTAFAIPENEINYFTQTEKGRTELADRWIESHDNDLESSRTALLRSDVDKLGINDALKLVFLTRIQVKALERWSEEKNPVDKLRWLKLARETDRDAQNVASEQGQGLQAAQQRIEMAAASGPVMDYINGILQGQQIALGKRFPEVISDNVRKWLAESADIAIAKIKKEVSEAANVADRKLKQGVEELETTFRDIMTASVKTQRNVQQEIYRRIRTHKNLKDLTSAEALELTNLLAAAWHKARMKVFRTEFRKSVPLPNIAESDKAKLEASIPDIIKQANLGLFDNEAFRNAVAPRYGAKSINEATAKKIFEASQKAQDKPEGAQRNEAFREVFNIVKREAGLTNSQLLGSWWYAAVLSGFGTQVRNVLGTSSNLVSNFAALSVREPKAIAPMIMGLLRGFRMNAQGEFQSIMSRGAPSSRIGTDIREAANALEIAKDDPRAWVRLLSNGKYVSRFMIATDSFFHDAAVETKAVFDAFRDGKEQGLTRAQLQNYIFDTLKLTESQRTAAIAQAKSEIAGGLTNKNDLQRRTNEILRQLRPDEIRARSGQFALDATFNNQPTGLLGVIANKAIDLRSQFPVLTPIIPFIRISANVGNMLLNHSPVGLARLIYARPGAKLLFGGKFDYRLTVDQWQQLRAQVILSHSFAIGLAILSAATADDDEPIIEISGNFRNIPPAKRRQLEESGRRAYSVKIAGKSFVYNQTPLAAFLAMIGNYLDGVKYGDLEEKDLSIQAATAFAGGYMVIMDQNYLSSIGMFLGSGSQIGKDANTVPFVRMLARTVGGVVPTMAKDIDTWINPEVQKSVEAWDYFQQEVPVLRWAIDRPMLNALGEPIERARYPWTALFSSEKDDPIWQALSEKARAGVFLPVASASAKVLHNGVREKMTDEEFWRYQKAVGTAYKKYFQTGNNLQEFRAMTPAQAEQLFETTFSKLRTSEREKLR